MADESIKSVMDRHGIDVTIDNKLLLNIHRWRVGFAHKNQDHAKFFGGNLFGVYPIRFLAADRLDWTDGILGLDEYAVRQDIIALPTVDEDWVRGTDVMNISCLWLVHKLYNSQLSPKQKEIGMKDTLLSFHYKLITSLMTHYFKYPANEATALATYNALSKKFSLKQYGSWQKMLEARCDDIISKQSIHFRTIERFNDDGAIQYMITDIQGRLRSIMKNMYEVFEQVRAQDAKVLGVGGTLELDGISIVRDMSREYTAYSRYIHEVVQDKQRFLKPELMQVIASAMRTMPESLFGDTLLYVTEHAGKGTAKDIEDLVDETMLHAFNYLSKDRGAFQRSNDINQLITKLMALYKSSRTSDPAMLKMRVLAEKIVQRSIKSKNGAVIAAVRTGLLLYIVARAFTKKHYG